MTREEFFVFVNGIRGAYEAPDFLDTKEKMELWYTMLGDIPYNTASLALQKWIATQKWIPKISDIRQSAMDVTGNSIGDWGDGWQEVLDAIRRFGYYRYNEAMESMSPITQKCVKRLGWSNLCLSTNQNQDRANFRMMYEEYKENESNMRILPQKLRNTITDLQQLMIERKEKYDD